MPESRSPILPQTVRHRSGGAITILVTAAESGGAIGMVEAIIPPGLGPTYHTHSKEDETFYVVSGIAEIRLENEIYLCKAGDRVFGPRGVFHTFRNVGDSDLKLVAVYSPGGFEQSFVDAEAMLDEGKDQNDLARMLSKEYGLTRGQLPG